MRPAGSIDQVVPSAVTLAAGPGGGAVAGANPDPVSVSARPSTTATTTPCTTTTLDTAWPEKPASSPPGRRGVGRDSGAEKAGRECGQGAQSGEPAGWPGGRATSYLGCAIHQGPTLPESAPP